MKRFLKNALRGILLFAAVAGIPLLCSSSADFRGRYMSLTRFERETGRKIEEIYDTWKVTPWKAAGEEVVTMPAYAPGLPPEGGSGDTP